MNIPEKILRLAEGKAEETSGLLSGLVRIPSPSGEEEKVVRRLGEELADVGFDDVRVDGFGNLIGTIGSGPKRLAVDAHIDTVGPGDQTQWEDDPFSGAIRDGWVYGRGSVDQKGGAAAMVSAAAVLKALSYEGPYSVTFTFTVMEEDCDGLCWKYLIEREKLVPDCAVITEPTNLGLYRGQRGRMEMDVSYQGVSAHGSAPERGENAVYKAAEGVLKIRELHTRLGDDEFLGRGSAAVTSVTSQGPSLCAIPDAAAFHIDRRLTWGETSESAVAEMRDALGAEAKVEVPDYDRPSYKGTVFRQQMVFPTWKLPEDHALMEVGKAAYQRLFRQPPRTGKWTFSTNGVAICGRAGIPTMGFGPGDEIYAHAPNEKIPEHHLVKASAFYAMLPYVLGEMLP